MSRLSNFRKWLRDRMLSRQAGVPLGVRAADVSRGEWRLWVDSGPSQLAVSAGFASSTYEMLLKSANLADLESLQIDASALYLLAQPSTPEEARTAALEKAASPDGISRDEVAALIEQATQQAAAKATAEAPRRRPPRGAIWGANRLISKSRINI